MPPQPNCISSLETNHLQCFVYSLLSYWNLVWGTTMASIANKIYLLEKKKKNVELLSVIFNAPSDSHTETMFSNLQMLKIHNRSDYRLLITINNEKKIPVLLNEIAALEKNNTVYFTRHNEHWKISTCRSHYGQQLLRYLIPKVLNSFGKKKREI